MLGLRPAPGTHTLTPDIDHHQPEIPKLTASEHQHHNPELQTNRVVENVEDAEPARPGNPQENQQHGLGLQWHLVALGLHHSEPTPQAEKEGQCAH